ncbi:MAG: biopolymer transporter ExbD [Deltaproteobacteria bacterium]|nr:biopolymer transporter ExbD [Deltaproteobacteria bacterium]
MGADVGVKKGPRSDINITPLVDVVLVLLIIFMVLTPLMEKEISVRVPDKEEVTPPPPPDPDYKQFIMRVDAEGKFTINGNPTTDDTAVEDLKKWYSQAKALEAKQGKPIIFFEADDKTKYVRAVTALDLIKQSTKDRAEPWIIGMMTEKLAEQGGAEGTPGAPTPAPAPAPGPK